MRSHAQWTQEFVLRTTIFGGDILCAGGIGCEEVFEPSPSNSGPWTKTLVHAFTDTPGRPRADGGPFLDSYLAAATDFTEIVSPLTVPVTLACSQASLFSSSNED